MLASSSTWNKDTGIVIVMRLELRECQLLLAWFSISAVEEICLLTIDVYLVLHKLAWPLKRVRIYLEANIAGSALYPL